jgi:ABC-type Mn2+/Zn2+ transport system ATPase subunit
VNRSVETLRELNLEVRRGQLVAVVGPVGSGKSSFLAALLGEMNLLGGEVSLVGSIAYCEQRPWILNATVEQNILFGEPMNVRRFDAAIYAANLEDDIKVLPGGIQTEIGERGINLSGGQKARVALARAVYKNCDVYLLDDPLSAVDVSDLFITYYCLSMSCPVLSPASSLLFWLLISVQAHVGQHIFKHCIKGALKGKTRILVTHQVSPLLLPFSY